MVVCDGIKAHRHQEIQPMKHLILIRHAKSSWDNPGSSDFDRVLNKRGERDAPVMGERLAALDLDPDVIFSSPAVRAITTAKVVAEKIGYPEEKILTSSDIYDAETQDLFAVLSRFKDEWNRVIVFGHNPGFTDLANVLGNGSISNVPTCGVVTLELGIESWEDVRPGCGTIVSFDFPKNVD